MKSFIVRSLLLLGALFTAACNVGGGSSANPPGGVRVTPGDGGVTVTWTMESGVEYWVFTAATTNLTPDNWVSQPQARAVRNATSPQVITGLTNGTTYSVTINARTSGGPGGAGSPSVSFVPRLAGLTWTPGTPLPSSNLKGLGFAALTFPGLYVAVGAAGSAFASTDAISWTAVTTGVTAELNAVTYGGGRHVAVGAGGVVINSLEAQIWTTQNSGTTQTLNGVVLGANGLVAVGDNGTIIRSTDGGTGWALSQSPSPQHLYSVTYGTRYVAVGANGTIHTSADGEVWTAVASTKTTRTLKSIAYSVARTLYVAVGEGGTILSSPDAVTWTVVTPVNTNDLNSVNFGNQFTIAGNAGSILVSTDGASFISVPSGTTANLNAVIFGLLGYGIVGVGGVNLSSY